MKFDFNGKTALVTGGSSGIGLACAGMLAASGARVAIASRNIERLTEAADTLPGNSTVKPYQLDVSDTATIEPVVNKIREDLGEIDILVCSAGVNVNRPAHEFTEEDWDSIISVNAKGTFFCNQAVAVRSMIPRRKGAIMNIGSQMGIVGGQKRAIYCASKGAVNQFSRAEAIDWAPYNIRVNVVAPTFVSTAMTEQTLTDPESRAWVMDNILFDRLATLEEVAAAVCYLASDEAAIITGVVFPVDGGWTAK